MNTYFTDTEQEFIKAILYYVCGHIDYDIETLLQLFNIEHKDSLDYLNKHVAIDTTKCKTLIVEDVQCSRNAKKEGFCLTHYKLFANNKLDANKIIKNTCINKFNEILVKLRSKKSIPTLISTKLTIIDDKEYLFDPFTKKVYDFDNFTLIGKIDQFNRLKHYTMI